MDAFWDTDNPAATPLWKSGHIFMLGGTSMWERSTVVFLKIMKSFYIDFFINDKKINIKIMKINRRAKAKIRENSTISLYIIPYFMNNIFFLCQHIYINFYNKMKFFNNSHLYCSFSFSISISNVLFDKKKITNKINIKT